MLVRIGAVVVLASGANYPALNDDPGLFACFVVVVAVLSLGLFTMCQWRRWTAIIAVVFTVLWVIFLLPDTQYYLDSRNAPPHSIVEPFYRTLEIRGYVLVLLPVPFVLFGLWLRCKSSI
jgi:hypothetical protein